MPRCHCGFLLEHVLLCSPHSLHQRGSASRCSLSDRIPGVEEAVEVMDSLRSHVDAILRRFGATRPLQSDLLPETVEHHHLPRCPALGRANLALQDLLHHGLLRPLLPAAAHHSGVLRAGHLVTEQSTAWGSRMLAQENQSSGDGFDHSGDVRAVFHTHELSASGALPAVQRGSPAEPGRPRWLLRSLSGLYVFGKPQLPAGSSGLLLWIVPMPERTIPRAEVSEDHREHLQQSLVI